MAIESSGAISLGTAAGTNRSISGEFGGTVPHALSEYYGVATGVPSSPNPLAFSDFHGTSAFSFATPGTPTNNILHLDTERSIQSAISRCKVGFQFRNTGSGGTVRAAFLHSSSVGNGLYDGTSANESVINLFDYSGADPASMQIRMDWTEFQSVNSGSSGANIVEPTDLAGGSWTKNAFRTIATGTSDNFNSSFTSLTNGDFTWGEWVVNSGTSPGLTIYRTEHSGGSGVSITAKALDASGNTIATSSTRVVTVNIKATRTSGGGFGGGP